MSEATFYEWVEAVTFRRYSTAERSFITQAALQRVFDELQTPWNRRVESIELQGTNSFILPAGLRKIAWVQYALRFIPHCPDEMVNQVRAQANGQAGLGYIQTITTGDQPGLALVPDTVAPSEDYVYVGGWGYPASGDQWQLLFRYPSVHTWAGAVEGFQLQGDEQGRDRALSTFALEVGRANEHGEHWVDEYQGAPQDSIGWRT